MLQPFRDQLHEIRDAVSYFPSEAREVVAKALLEKLMYEFVAGYHGEYSGLFKERSTEPQE